MFNGILAYPLRGIGPNDVKFFQSTKGQRIQQWIMLVPMPPDIDTLEYIPLFISNFQTLCKKPYIRSAYKAAIGEISQHPGLITQVSADGTYWNIIDSAVEKDIIYRTKNSLSEVLLDKDIREIVSSMFGVNKDISTWSESVTRYAFGNKSTEAVMHFESI